MSYTVCTICKGSGKSIKDEGSKCSKCLGSGLIKID